MNGKSHTSTGKLIAVIAVVLIVLCTGYYFNAPELLKTALAWIQGQGAVGYLVFMILYVLACVFFIPGTILTLGAGVIYGVGPGSAIVSVASTLGAGAAFLVGRYAARDFVEKKISGNASFRAIDEAVAREGGKIVFLTRLSPIFPFNLLNYGYGLTKVNFLSYILASWIGMLPGTVMYVYIGSLGGDIATIGSGGGESSTLQWILKAVGLTATVIVTVFVTKIARKALQEKVESHDN